MIGYRIEPMPGNPAANKVGAKTGKWKVVAYDQEPGGVIEDGPGLTIEADIDYEDAENMLASLDRPKDQPQE